MNYARRLSENTFHDRKDPGLNIFVRTNSHIQKVYMEDILWVKALGNYVIIQTTKERHTVHTTMKAVLDKLSMDFFARVHRSYIVKVDQITEIQGNQITIYNEIIPIGKTYKKALMKNLNFI